MGPSVNIKSKPIGVDGQIKGKLREEAGRSVEKENIHMPWTNYRVVVPSSL